MLEYDGTNFAGWQQQSKGRTVERELKRALRSITGKDVAVYAAGRTDAGAHAEGQVASFRTDGRLGPQRLMAALNARLPEDVAVLSAEEVGEGFHARYSARWRRYRYRYLDRPARPALERGRCWHVRGARLDVAAMSRAAKALVGKHDWTSYCSASEPARDRVREMRSASVARRGDFVELELVAEGFLRGLVRSIAGALAEVGRGERPPEWVGEVLRARDRRKAPRTAPAGGLTLMEVLY
ncbi:MAG TPA: tRNA pseudouridine(38-40) synthase TruA [Candidatus Dormibacteraeota bacterium]|nr:tRNA pseudouridine(38-40) synthase TruA [Candidatus Dormibacteraeota bacterium]